MTYAEKIQMLRQYQYLERRISRLLAEKQVWEDKAVNISPVYSNQPKGGSGGNKMQTCIDKLMEIEQRLDTEIDRQIDLRTVIENAICQLEDERLRDVLRYRYIDGMTIDATADEMRIDQRWVCCLQKRAINKLTIEIHY